ncbi:MULTISPECIES: protocatechuate 3,4-dioxygenase [unclassified Nitrosomonas]|jgi:protocatechuate 3,4-dioxygenase beta subunit|uniref:dioxygenase family protein n=1 Tax=unclassified Nitrosomonas TaxID=2609265 RepID=UPI000886697A|nr:MULTISPECIES: protocatechuate 3,4-dioxygenase [unclassified Nitrosomonas]SDH05212.1 protocatechuate 3,4-dioxygenase beta subunit [Nitrosomonas sp. Nm132]SDY14106.1 protocatechuate 3,4-dioxygenase beta subunit [Nitrosomonas sp. Nm58]
MKSLSRRKLLKLSMMGVAGAFTAEGSLAKALLPTPPETEGPFYPVTPQDDKDFDLTQVQGRDGVAEGKHIIVKGSVLDSQGQPVPHATVEIWQANAKGRYRHPRDPNSAPLDPNFQGWAIVLTDEQGEFRFKTVMPGAYPASETWMRPPHIHFKIAKKGYVELTTQMYFPDEALNETDLLLNDKKPSERLLMIARKRGPSATEALDIYEYAIVLEQKS